MDHTPLSDREIDILKLVGQGKTNKEIAAELVISINTVKVHMANIFQKINASSRTEATLYAIEHGIIKSPATVVPDVQVLVPQSSDQDPNKLQSFLRRYWWAVILLFLLILLGSSFALSRSKLFTARAPTPDIWEIMDFDARWQALPNLPETLTEISAFPYENNIVVFGRNADAQTISKVFNLTTQEWSDLNPKPIWMGQAASALLAEKVYFIGGVDANGKPSVLVEVFDLRANTWEKKSDLPQALQSASAIGFEGKLYLFGGSTDKGPSLTAWVYDPSSNLWAPASPLPAERENALAVASEGKIYLTGGNAGGLPLTSSSVFNPYRPKPESWQPGIGLPEGYQIFNLASRGGVQYGFARDSEGRNLLLQFEAGQQVWTQLELPSSVELRQDSDLVFLDNYLYLIGGIGAKGTASTAFDRFQVNFSNMLPMIQN